MAPSTSMSRGFVALRPSCGRSDRDKSFIIFLKMRMNTNYCMNTVCTIDNFLRPNGQARKDHAEVYLFLPDTREEFSLGS